MPILEIVFSSAFADRFDDVLRPPRSALDDDLPLPSAPARVIARWSSTMLVERLEHQVRVDRARAVADQRREVVHLARLAGLQDDARAQARALAHEVVVDRGDRQQRRDRRAARPEQRGRRGR